MLDTPVGREVELGIRRDGAPRTLRATTVERGAAQGTEGEVSGPAPPAAPGISLERAELRESMRKAIDGLPDDARRTFLLREVDGLSYAEIARALEIPKGTVMSRLHYARRRLREALLASGAAGSVPETSGGLEV